jgi:hypothetical protein
VQSSRPDIVEAGEISANLSAGVELAVEKAGIREE